MTTQTTLLIALVVGFSLSDGQTSNIDNTLQGTMALRINSPSLPDHYLREKIEFVCSFELNKVPDSSVQSLTITSVDETPAVFIGCNMGVAPDGSPYWSSINYPTDNNDVDVSALMDTCRNLPVEPTLRYDLTVQMKLTRTAEYQCLLKTNDRKEMRSDSEKIENIKEPPTGLTLQVEPDTELFVGESFSFTCTSRGGNPLSIFHYGIGEDQFDEGTIHTATSLHNKLKVWCKDTEHTMLNGGGTEATEQQQQLSIYYLTVNMAENNVSLNPMYNNEIQCDSDSNLPTNVSLMYKWYEDSNLLTEKMDKSLLIEERAVNATPTIFSCHVYSNDGVLGARLGEKEIKFYVTWDDGARPSLTTIIPVTRPKEKLSDKGKNEQLAGGQEMTTVIVIVVIVVAAVIVVIIVIIIVKKRQSQSGSADIKKAQTRDAEHAPTGEASEPMLSDRGNKPVATHN